MALELNKTDTAALFGVVARTITEWQQQPGFPQPRADGRQRWYPAYECLQWWLNRQADNEPGAQAGSDPDSLEEGRRRKIQAEASLAELDLSAQCGKLVSIDDMEREWLKIVGNARSRMLALPDKLAARLGPVVDPHKIRQIIEREVTEALEQLSDGSDTSEAA